MFRISISAVDPLVAADAPLASDNDNPAAPNTGTALPLRFRFEACFARNMVESPTSNAETAPRGPGLGLEG